MKAAQPLNHLHPLSLSDHLCTGTGTIHRCEVKASLPTRSLRLRLRTAAFRETLLARTTMGSAQ